VDGTFKGFPTSIEQIFLFLASYSLTKMPTGQKLAEHIVAKLAQGTPILNVDTSLAYGKLNRSTFRLSI